jgi:hypothetical protein
VEAEAAAGEGLRGLEDGKRQGVRVVDTGPTVGDDGEAAGQPWGREWDGAETLRGANRLLTMPGQSTDGVVWSLAALGPWLGPLI